MYFLIALISLVAPSLVSAAPWKRAASSDVAVLQFADVLEQLESNFYMQALQKFTASDFQAAGFSLTQIPIQQFTQIGGDETTHSVTLQSAIQANGGQPITNCVFDFSSVLTDVTTMAATARVVENVGVGAYLGVASLVSDPVLLTAAASILTVEARHQTVLNLLNGATAIPQAFDIALTPPQVLAIAGAFVSSCDLGISANPSLTVTNTGPIQPGNTLSFQSAAINGSIPASQMFCQMLAGGLPFSISLPFNQCTVPQGINGPVAIFITSDSQPLAASVIQQATSQLVAGPTMAFIDTQTDVLGQMIRMSSNSSSVSANTTMSSDVVSTSMFSTSTAYPALTGYATSTSASTSTSPSASSVPAANVAGGAITTMGLPNMATGPSPDGNVNVNGWTDLPNSTTTS